MEKHTKVMCGVMAGATIAMLLIAGLNVILGA